MRKLWTIVAVMVAVSFIGLNLASAEDAPKKKGEHKRPPIKEIFKKLDTNEDGGICVKELEKSSHIDGEKKAKEILGKWDANKDGKVCIKELAAALKKIHAILTSKRVVIMDSSSVNDGSILPSATAPRYLRFLLSSSSGTK